MSVPSFGAAAPEMRSCPYLGLQNDPGTCLGYPAEWNLCYRASPASAVSLEQQRRLCLSPVYAQCTVFGSERRRPLPRQLRGARMGKPWKWALLAVLVFLTAFGVWAILQALYLFVL